MSGAVSIMPRDNITCGFLHGIPHPEGNEAKHISQTPLFTYGGVSDTTVPLLMSWASYLIIRSTYYLSFNWHSGFEFGLDHAMSDKELAKVKELMADIMNKKNQ